MLSHLTHKNTDAIIPQQNAKINKNIVNAVNWYLLSVKQIKANIKDPINNVAKIENST